METSVTVTTNIKTIAEDLVYDITGKLRLRVYDFLESRDSTFIYNEWSQGINRIADCLINRNTITADLPWRTQSKV